jgi:hypothetical protein
VVSISNGEKVKASRLALLVLGVATVGGVGVATVGVLTHTATAGGSRPAAGPPAIDTLRPVSSGRDIVLPFDSYRPTTAEVNTIERATAALARDCMHRFGLDWALPAADAAGADSPSGSRRYGVLDQAEVSRLGYHPPPETTQPVTAAAAPALDAVAVYAGKGAGTVGGHPVPDGGCLGEARRTLGAGVPSSLDGARFAELDIQLFSAAQADGRVQAAMARWRTCMAESGYDYADVWVANDDVRWTAPAPSPAEIATATADVACRKQTDLVPTWLAVESAYQRRAISERASEFDALKTGKRVRLNNATRVLSEQASAK